MRCCGARYTETRIDIALGDIHDRVDAVVTTFRDGTTRVSCLYLDRDTENQPICRARERHLYAEKPLSEEYCPPCIYAFDDPRQVENTLSRSVDEDDQEEVEDEERVIPAAEDVYQEGDPPEE
ncbi:MAG TPA: hypothetical protein PKD72_04170 [Gemmatales bacterium]|nr:hypothetical protein [Gemmatales bacterium]